MGQQQHPPALAGRALDDGADGLALARTGGHDGTDPAVDLEGGAEIGQQLLLVVAQGDRGHQDHRGSGQELATGLLWLSLARAGPGH